MLRTVPYASNMRLGQGFNSYTHETRIDNAVKISAVEREHRASVYEVNASQNGTLSPPETTKDSIPTLETSKAPYHIIQPQVWDRKQSVTYSSWQIQNVSEIVNALNLSTFALVKYATVEANVNASFIHDNKIRDSQLNYMVSVKVVNDVDTISEDMNFQPLENLPPERFTKVYGDCFISGFQEGGEFYAIISIKVNDKNKLKAVKQAVDVQLQVPPVPGLQIGAGESLDKSNSETFDNTETTISVKSTGGGVIKLPDSQWSLKTVVAVANAFPSMVATCPARIAAILSNYNVCRDFQSWKWKMASDPIDPLWKDFVLQDDHWENRLILSYSPCTSYVQNLFTDLLTYQQIDKRLREIMQDPTQFKPRKGPAKQLLPTRRQSVGPRIGVEPGTPLRRSRLSSIPKEVETEFRRSRSPRSNTFALNDPDVGTSWRLEEIDECQDPIALDLTTLKELSLICRSAQTLITEEAERLVDHPELSYSEFDDMTHEIRFNRPNYPIPELLEARLPVFVGNDATSDVIAQDDAILLTMKYSKGDDLYFHIVGDPPNARRTYKPFTTLEYSEKKLKGRSATSQRLSRMVLHPYEHKWWKVSGFSKDSQASISAIGLNFEGTGSKKLSPDKCSVHTGGSQSSRVGLPSLDLVPCNSPSLNVTKMEICYVPGNGRIAALIFYTDEGDSPPPHMQWRQWDWDGSNGQEPEGLRRVTQTPPKDGEKWRFVGLTGSFDSSFCGSVLARVSGIWRRS